ARDISDVRLQATATVAETATPYCGATPYGPAYVSYENVYLGLGNGVGKPIAALLTGDAADPTMARIIWHNQFRLVFVPGLNYYNSGCFVLDPLSGSWGRMDQPGTPSGFNDHTVTLYGVPNSDVMSPTWKHVWTNGGDIYVERTVAPGGDTRVAFVETKDFAMPAGRYVDRMRVD